jgi:hypothetical protein
VLLDSHDDVVELVEAGVRVAILARLAANRRFYRAPGPYAGKDAPRKHGPVFRCAEPATHGRTDRTQFHDDADYGLVRLDGWERWPVPRAPLVPLTVIRVSVAHLPRRSTPPKPLWLVWWGTARPADLRVVWRWYQRRLAVAPLFRCLNTPWAGRPSIPAPRRRPTARGGCWRRESGRCGWGLISSPTGGCPGSGRRPRR